jgi:hypothetical protein
MHRAIMLSSCAIYNLHAVSLQHQPYSPYRTFACSTGNCVARRFLYGMTRGGVDTIMMPESSSSFAAAAHYADAGPTILAAAACLWSCVHLPIKFQSSSIRFLLSYLCLQISSYHHFPVYKFSNEPWRPAPALNLAAPHALSLSNTFAPSSNSLHNASSKDVALYAL